MQNIRHKTPTEESFVVWMGNYPETFHALGERLFYQFAHCVFSYGAKKWLDKSYFKRRILKINPNFNLENIDVFYNRLLILRDYNDSYRLESITTSDHNDGFVQRQVIDDKIESVVITESEFLSGGLNKKDFMERLK